MYLDVDRYGVCVEFICVGYLAYMSSCLNVLYLLVSFGTQLHHTQHAVGQVLSELDLCSYRALSEHLDLFTQLTECHSEHAGGESSADFPELCAVM